METETPEIQNPFSEEETVQQESVFTSSENKLEVTFATRMHLKEMSKWTKFFAILNFIGAGFLTLAAISLLFMSMSYGIGSGLIAFFIYICVAIVLVFLGRYLLKFSEKTSAINISDNAYDLEEAFLNMQSYWKVIGIITFIWIGILVLALIIGLHF